MLSRMVMFMDVEMKFCGHCLDELRAIMTSE